MSPTATAMQSNGKTVLVTGGAGYIGSHCVVTLQLAGYAVVALDNFANSVNGTNYQSAAALERVEQITGQPVKFYRCDLLNKNEVDDIFRQHRIDAVIHLAAMKAVGESMQFPMLYYKNNLIGMINLLEVMKDHGCRSIVFSSSCTVYGEPERLPITEENETGRKVTNVYGKTKYFVEEMLKDVSHADEVSCYLCYMHISNSLMECDGDLMCVRCVRSHAQSWNIIALRYFNPVGAHESGMIGEDPTKQFTNIMPYISQVAMGKKESLMIFGNDYDTPDGTGIRDYIHVMDLADGHVAALAKLESEHLKIRVGPTRILSAFVSVG